MSKQIGKRNPLVFVFIALFFISVIVSFLIEKYGHLDHTSRNYSPDELQGIEFLDGLPPACNDSHIKTMPEGVVITVLCSGDAKSNNGKIAIKDGIVTSIEMSNQ